MSIYYSVYVERLEDANELASGFRHECRVENLKDECPFQPLEFKESDAPVCCSVNYLCSRGRRGAFVSLGHNAAWEFIFSAKRGIAERDVFVFTLRWICSHLRGLVGSLSLVSNGNTIFLTMTPVEVQCYGGNGVWNEGGQLLLLLQAATSLPIVIRNEVREM